MSAQEPDWMMPWHRLMQRIGGIWFRWESGDGQQPVCHLRLSVGTTAMSNVLVIILILLLVGAIPAWPYSRGWGYYPSGIVGVLLVVVLVLLLTGRL